MLTPKSTVVPIIIGITINPFTKDKTAFDSSDSLLGSVGVTCDVTCDVTSGVTSGWRGTIGTIGTIVSDIN